MKKFHSSQTPPHVKPNHSLEDKMCPPEFHYSLPRYTMGHKSLFTQSNKVVHSRETRVVIDNKFAAKISLCPASSPRRVSKWRKGWPLYPGGSNTTAGRASSTSASRPGCKRACATAALRSTCCLPPCQPPVRNIWGVTSVSWPSALCWHAQCSLLQN